MANIITEVYISIDGLEYLKLDLHKDESILMKHTQKDLQDISKIFSPYSKDFTFPATPKNRKTFGFFGDTDIVKINTDSKFLAKLYSAGVLNNVGYVQLSNLRYVENKPEDFTGSFTTSMANLKDRIGDDLLSDLLDLPAEIPWTINNIQSLLQSKSILNVDGIDIEYFVPLISNNRVWGYDLSDDSVLLDNVAYDSGNLITGNNYIKTTELRPCINYGSVLEFIKKKYSLEITAPIETRNEYKDLVVYCNSEQIASYEYKVLPVLSPFAGLQKYDTKNEGGIPDPKKYTANTNITDNTFIINKRPLPFTKSSNYIEGGFNFRVDFSGLIITGDVGTPAVNLQYIRKSDDVIFKTENFEITGSSIECNTFIDDDFFAGLDTLEFYIKVQFKQPTSWTNCLFRMYFRYYDGKTGLFNTKRYAWYYYQSSVNNNSALITTDNIDLFKSLPETKVADFLTSHFKIFNISVFDTSPSNEDLFWLTPSDVNTSGLEYSKAEADYTKYLDSKNYDKEKPTDYNYYNFKHSTSEYFSNKKYLDAFPLEYGQTVYPTVKPTDVKEFKVETNFSIIPPVRLTGAAGVVTAYAFTADTPDVIETGESRYTPNYDELTIFYNHGNTSCPSLGVIGTSTFYIFGLPIIQTGIVSLNSYMKVMPFNKDGYSFAFSILQDLGVDYIKNLFSENYANQITRLLDPNVLSQKFVLDLPPSEIYLNAATTIQGGGETPVGFRLQNDIILSENKFSIIDAEIDITTGKTKLTLLNY